jgi:hypothetical protein
VGAGTAGAIRAARRLEPTRAHVVY